MAKSLLVVGALVMAVAVALGAYSAHATRAALHPDAARLLQTAVLYQLVHGLGLLIAGVIARQGASRWLMATAILHSTGIVLFCVPLWVLALSGRSLGLAAPVGGMALIAGWVTLAIHAGRHKP
jgi:uncharacterized membrane protein YgdD (TMEM256/DUF423 family)